MNTNHTTHCKRIPFVAMLMFVGVAWWIVGCEDDGDFSHQPAAGMGAVIVDNMTPDDVEVYVDGVHLGQVGNDHDRAFDLTPGVHRIVIDDEHGDRNAADDFDILQDRLTVLEVRLSGIWHHYDLSLYFQ